MAFSLLSRLPPFRSAAEAKRNIKRAVCQVAGQLGNTPAICRKSYVDESVLEAYLRNERVSAERRLRGLRKDEQALLALLGRNAPEC